ncbi:hypothetical protein C8R45DRAFT_1047329 [Mycena sanguinolenta]|nr:hypothetical protein C8R45DRAFT_1047329 [Mycena sanguinolenta]
MNASGPLDKCEDLAAEALLIFPTGTFSFVRSTSTSVSSFRPGPYDETHHHLLPPAWTRMMGTPRPMLRPPASPSARLGDAHGEDAARGGGAAARGGHEGVFFDEMDFSVSVARSRARARRARATRACCWRWAAYGSSAKTNIRCTVPSPPSPPAYTSTSVSTSTSPTFPSHTSPRPVTVILPVPLPQHRKRTPTPHAHPHRAHLAEQMHNLAFSPRPSCCSCVSEPGRWWSTAAAATTTGSAVTITP